MPRGKYGNSAGSVHAEGRGSRCESHLAPRVNELTYPSFDVDDPKDMRRLLQGYTEARRAGRFARPGSEVLAELRRAIEVH